MSKTPSVNGAFAYLMRHADPNSGMNRKIIISANVAADELCRSIREGRPENSEKTYRDIIREACVPDEESSITVYLTDDWLLVLKADGELILAREQSPHVFEMYGVGRCRSVMAARVIAYDIRAAGGREAWIRGMLQCVITWFDEFVA